VVEQWERDFGVRAGVVGGPVAGDFSLPAVEAGGSVPAQWDVLRTALGFAHVMLARQVHGTEIKHHMGRRAGDGVEVLDGYDGHVTAQAGVLLAVTVADCVPVFLIHPPSGTLALLHAGWRGVAAGMLGAGVRAVSEVASASAHTIVMHCGVSICGSCYEVGPEVAEAVEGREGDGPVHVDLRGVLCRQAGELGLARVTASPLCTAHGDERFYSHRASGGTAGRMLAYVGLPTA
jgi:YfiH family protein